MKKQNYAELLRSPMWQKKRLEIMQRDNFTCQHCGSTQKSLQVHHLWYSSLKKPWEYENDCYITLCEDCHELETEYNSILYTSFCDLKTIAGQKGFSKQFLDAVLTKLSSFILADTIDSANYSVSDLFYEAACDTRLHSDAKTLGVDVREFLSSVKTKSE